MALDQPPIQEKTTNLLGVFPNVWVRWLNSIKTCVDDIISRLTIVEAQVGTDYYFEVAAGRITGSSVVHKFGRDPSIGTSFTPISVIQDYWTPTAASSLEVISSSANDAAAGTGAQKIMLQGLDENWELAEEEVTTNGTSASTATTKTFIRFFRGFVTQSGTYATSAAGSHAGTVTIRVSSGGATVGQLGITDFPKGQTQIGAYTIPINKTGYVKTVHYHVDSNKSGSILFFQRPNANDVSSPYTGAMRLISEFDGIQGAEDMSPATPMGPFVGPCDIGFLGKVSTGSGSISIDFEIILEDD